MVSVIHFILRFPFVQKKFQQTNKTKINHINDNHIKFEVSLHFWQIWPTVRRRLAATIYLVKNCRLETFQDFSIKLDIEPLMHLLKISIFSLNSDIIRLTKIMNNLVKDCKIRTFKVIFQCLKLVESFRKKNSVKNI